MGVGGLQVHGIFNCKLVYREVVEALSNYKKSYLWLFRIIACDDPTGVTRLKKTKFVYHLDLFREMGEKGWCDLVCVKCLKMIGLMVLLLMSFSRMVKTLLVLWGVGPILGNGYGI